jgi:predicted NUDIX family NTP pyrophosphohydrolase
MAKRALSAGILPVRLREGTLEVFLVHPGGPFYVRKDEGVWSVAKGLVDPDEDLLVAAQRELVEETGFTLPAGPYVPIGRVTQSSGKVVEAWAVRADFDAATLVSNTFELEWPPRSGRIERFPEVDRAAWYDLPTAAVKILPAQRPFLERVKDRRAELVGG